MKRLNLFALMLLLIGQTILGPIGMVSAAEVSTDNMVEESTLVPVVPEEEAVEATCDDQTGELVVCDEVLTPNASIADIDPEVLTSIKTSFIELKIGDHSIKSSEDAKGIELKEGQKATIHYGFEVKMEKPYAAGSTFTFQLPQSIVVFEKSSLSGEVRIDDEPPFKYETDETGLVTVTFLEKLMPNQYKMNLNFAASFGNFGNSDDLDQTLEIPLEGNADVSLDLTFLPSTSNDKLTKEGAVESKDGKKYINWTVWANTAGKELNSAILKDELGEGHELVGPITVEQYKVGLKGKIEPAIKTTSSDISFPINLEDGKFAYKVTYQTEVTRVATNEKETFTNNATLTNGGTDTENKKANVDITYGTPLTKSQTAGDKYKANWEIQYNYLGAEIAEKDAVITDELIGAHKIDADSIRVFEVMINAEGKEVADSAKKLTKGTHYTTTESDRKLVVDFGGSATKGQLTKAFKVTYDTISTEEFITGNTNVKNTVTSKNKDSSDKSYTATGTLPLGEGIFSKTRGSVDFNNKIITWKLVINAEKELKNFKIEDAFTEIDGSSHQTLLPNGDGKYFTITGYDANTTEIVDPTKGYTLTFKDAIPQGKTVTITYQTKFDILPNGAAYATYGNKATATWKGSAPNNNSITKIADYTPGNTPTGNNGYKNGEFDHKNQKFNWNIAVNINKQDINGATLTDKLGEGHHIAIPVGKDLQSQISIKQLDLGNEDDTGKPGIDLPIANWDVTPIQTGDFVTEFTITFKDLNTDQKNQAYYIHYQTVDSDDIIGQPKDSNKYVNNATFTTGNTNYPFKKEVTIKHANDLISKQAKTDADTETILWTVDVNQSHSHLGNIKLTDKPSANQILLKDTIRFRESAMNEKGDISYGEWQLIDPSAADKVEFTAEGGFVLDVGELINKGVQVEYRTFFTGANDEVFGNQASIDYEDMAVENDATSKEEKGQFKFNSSSGNISSDKGTVKLHKVGYNPVTKESVSLKDVKFELYNKTGEYKLDEATSDDDGYFTFENVRYGIYVIKEVEAPTGYIKVDNIVFTMDGTTNTLVTGNEDKVIEVKNIKISQAVKLTKVSAEANEKDEHGNAIHLEGAEFSLYHESGAIVTVKDEEGNDKELTNLITDSNGEIIVNNLEVGEYYFEETKAPDHYLLESNNKTDVFEIKKDQVSVTVVTKTNQRGKGRLVITKIDFADKDAHVNEQTPLDGATFKIYNSQKELVGTETTKNGLAEFNNLPYGDYTIEETDAPKGYAVNVDEKGNAVIETVTINGKENGVIANKTITNKKITRSVQLTKVDKNNHKKFLEGAIFELYIKTGTALDKEGNVVGVYEVVTGIDPEKLKTNTDGEIILDESVGLAPGNYQFIETKAPTGYQIDKTPVTFTITEKQTETIVVTKENTRIPTGGGGGNGGTPDPEPSTPTTPETPNPENPDPNEPVDPNEPETDKPEPDNPDPSNPDSDEVEGDNGVAGNKGDSGDGPSTSVPDDNAEGGNTGSHEKPDFPVANKPGEKLPQTGEQSLLYMTILGFALILIGGVMVGRRKINE